MSGEDPVEDNYDITDIIGEYQKPYPILPLSHHIQRHIFHRGGGCSHGNKRKSCYQNHRKGKIISE